MTSDFGIEALDPVQGTRLWDNAWDIQTNPRCTQPVVINGDSVLWGATGTSGSRRLRVEYAEGRWVPQEMWTTRQFRPYFNDGALHHGYYYGFDGERVDVEDGDAWRAHVSSVPRSTAGHVRGLLHGGDQDPPRGGGGDHVPWLASPPWVSSSIVARRRRPRPGS